MRRTFRNPFRREGWRADLDEELEFHLEARTRALMRQGMSEDAARAEARRRLGDVDRIATEVAGARRRRERRVRWTGLMDDLRQDIRSALRSFRRRPGSTALVLLTLALGIGATTAVFSVAWSVLWKPYPFQDPERVVSMYVVDRAQGWESDFGPAVLRWWREDARTLEGLAGIAPTPLTLTGLGEPMRVPVWQVTHGYFELLGAPLHMGRGFTPTEDQAGAPAAAILSHRAWTGEFSSDPDILGRTVEIEGEPATVVGVAGADLDLSPEMPYLYQPLRLVPEGWSNPSGGWLQIVGRRTPGASNQAVREELTGILRRAGALDGVGPSVELRVTSIRERFSDPARTPLLLLLGTVGLVLLVGCANVANLTMAQAVGRAREVAVRAALGAGRGRVARLFVTESLVLAAVGGALAVGVAHLFTPVLVRLAPVELPRLQQASVDPVALLFTAGLALVTALTFGLAPTLFAGRTDIRTVLADGGRGMGGRRTGRARHLLAGVQVALSVVLLSASGLLLRSVDGLARVDRGFDPQVVTARVALRDDRYPGVEDAVRTFRELQRTVAATPGVASAAFTSRAPFFGSGFGLPVTRAGEALDDDTGVDTALRIASPGYFATVGMELVAGREFTARDDLPGSGRVVINQALARTLGLGGDPVGRRITAHGTDFVDQAGRPLSWEVVGVVADARTESLRTAATAEAFFPPAAIPAATWSWIDRELVLAVRPSGDGPNLVPSVRRSLREVDPNLPVQNVRTLGDRVRASLAVERMLTVLVTGLGALALVLSAVGIFGVVAYGVLARVGEIGLRMALGSTAREVQALVVTGAMRPVVAGALVGVGALLLLGRWLEPVLFGVSARDPLTLFGTVAVLAAVGLAAAWVPSRRAARVDPSRILNAG